MVVTTLYALAVSAVFVLWLSRQPLSGRVTAVVCMLAVMGAGTLAVRPFLCDGGVGTGEAANYAWALQDAIHQLRDGHIPMVGETEVAFNGRVHPLRIAPYLFFLGGALDLLTARQLTVWQIQNLSVSLSLLALPCMLFSGLRRWAGASDKVAAWASACVVLSPGILALAHVHHILMAIHALPWVALAATSLVGRLRFGRLRLEWVCLGALALCWWSHPPIAFWTSSLLVPILVGRTALDRSLAHTASLLGAVGFAGVMAAYVFVSARSIQGAGSNGFSLASGVGNGLAISEILRQYEFRPLPGAVHTLTNQWPMQWLISIAAVVAACGFALAFPSVRRWGSLAGAAVLGWTLFQAVPSLRHGLESRWHEGLAEVNSLPSNLTLSNVAYASLGTNPPYANVPIAPWCLLKRVSARGEVRDDNLQSALATGIVRQEARMQVKWTQPGAIHLEPTFEIFPGHYYIVVIDWEIPGFDGILSLAGKRISQFCPIAGRSDLNLPHFPDPLSRYLIVNTELPTAESLTLHIASEGIDARHPAGTEIARARLIEVDLVSLPLVPVSWSPLRVRVRDSAFGDRLVTPRVSIPGYAATVNGRPTQIDKTAEGFVSIVLPAGGGEVACTYPRRGRLTFIFFLSVGAVAAGFAVALTRLLTDTYLAWMRVRLLAPAYLFCAFVAYVLASTIDSEPNASVARASDQSGLREQKGRAGFGQD